MSGSQLLWAIIKILVMIGFVFNVAALLTWVDRRQSAMIQDRIGPNRAYIKIFGKEFRVIGLLHTAADGVKFFFKEDFIPPKADKLLFGLAPILVMVPVLTLLAVVPFGDTLCTQDVWVAMKSGGHFFPSVPRFGVCALSAKDTVYPVDMMVSNLNVGLLFVFALTGQGIVGAAIAGWASDNKFSLMGALRAASQMVSYEVTIGLSLIGAMMIYGTVQLDAMVRWQGENTWGIFAQPVAFFLFFTAATAESKRIPFDLPEAESELVSGYFTEYSGMKFGMFYFAEYMEVVTSSMLLVTIFLGGWQLPFIHRDGITIAFGTTTIASLKMAHVALVIISVLVFFLKTILVCLFQAFIRWSLPRFRYDQLMKLGWRVLLPASLANIFVTGIVYLALDQAGPGVSNGLKLIADLTQTLLAVVITGFVVYGIIGMFMKRTKITSIIGSSAKFAQRLGGTKETAMQA